MSVRNLFCVLPTSDVCEKTPPVELTSDCVSTCNVCIYTQISSKSGVVMQNRIS